MQPWGLTLLPKAVDRLSAIIYLGGISLGLLLISLVVAAFMFRRPNYVLWWSTFLAIGIWIGYRLSRIDPGLGNVREYLLLAPEALLLILLVVAYPRCWKITLKGTFIWIAVLACGLGYLSRRERDIAQKQAPFLHQIELQKWAEAHRWAAYRDMRGFVYSLNIRVGDPIDFNDALKFTEIESLKIFPGIANPEALRDIYKLRRLTGLRIWNTRITNDFIDGFNKSKWLRGISFYSCQVDGVEFHRLDASQRLNNIHYFTITLFDTPLTRDQIEGLMTLTDHGLTYLGAVRCGLTEDDVVRLSKIESIRGVRIEQGLISPDVREEIRSRRPRFYIIEHRPGTFNTN